MKAKTALPTAKQFIESYRTIQKHNNSPKIQRAKDIVSAVEHRIQDVAFEVLEMEKGRDECDNWMYRNYVLRDTDPPYLAAIFSDYRLLKEDLVLEFSLEYVINPESLEVAKEESQRKAEEKAKAVRAEVKAAARKRQKELYERLKKKFEK